MDSIKKPEWHRVARADLHSIFEVFYSLFFFGQKDSFETWRRTVSNKECISYCVIVQGRVVLKRPVVGD